MNDKPSSIAGRFYKIVRDTAPRVLGARTCPNCRCEKPIERFKRVRRGKAWNWLCDTCFNNRRKPTRL